MGERSPLVSTAWLADHLHDADLVVLDCRWYLKPFDERDGMAEFAAGHIPGARHVSWDRELADPDRGALNMLAGPERFAAAMGRLGVGDASTVVTYDDHHVPVAVAGLVGAAGLRPRRRIRARRRHDGVARRGPSDRDRRTATGDRTCRGLHTPPA